MITTFKPRIYDEALDEIRGAFESGWVGLGPRVKAFEDAISGRLGAAHVIATSSCTASLEMALALHKIGYNNGGCADDEVITTPLTFVATNTSIVRAGAVPVFADIESSGTLNIDSNEVKRLLTRRTKAIMVVHLYGHPVDLDAFTKFGIPVIEDAAHAFGATYNGTPVGSTGNVCCFSFQCLKNLTCGGGGAIVVPSQDMYDTAMKLRWFGIDRDDPRRKVDGTYDLHFVGGKYNMNDINAAIGLGQLVHYDEDCLCREALVDAYMRHLEHNGHIILPVVEPYALHAWHTFTITVRSGKLRDALINYLRTLGVMTTILYRPSYYYDCLGTSKSLWKFSKCENAYRHILSLPLHMHMTLAEVQSISWAINKFFNDYGDLE